MLVTALTMKRVPAERSRLNDVNVKVPSAGLIVMHTSLCLGHLQDNSTVVSNSRVNIIPDQLGTFVQGTTTLLEETLIGLNELQFNNSRRPEQVI